ncbi:MAG: hypothetical protein V8S71_11230 [Oscillospiraceae bacterium]
MRNKTVQALLTSLLCGSPLGLLIGFVVLLPSINPSGAGKAIATILKNFMTYANAVPQKKYLGNTGENSCLGHVRLIYPVSPSRWAC